MITDVASWTFLLVQVIVEVRFTTVLGFLSLATPLRDLFSLILLLSCILVLLSLCANVLSWSDIVFFS